MTPSTVPFLAARGGVASTSSSRSSLRGGGGHAVRAALPRITFAVQPGGHLHADDRRCRHSCHRRRVGIYNCSPSPQSGGPRGLDRPTSSAARPASDAVNARRHLTRGGKHRGLKRSCAGAAGSGGGNQEAAEEELDEEEEERGGAMNAMAAASSAVKGLEEEKEEEDWAFEFPSSLENLGEQWRELPSRYRILLGTCFAFVLCNMVNISVAIIPMAKDMGWSVSTAGILQSAFFYGFALSQLPGLPTLLPGGYLATRFGGARMLPLGVFVWSAATAAVPFVAGDTKLLFVSRVLVGLGEGISPAAATDVIARTVPLEERSRAVAFVFNGFNIGSVLGLSAAPLIIETFGWKTVFFVFGAVGLLWVQWVGLGIYKRGGAMPGTPSDAAGPTARVSGLTGQRTMLPDPEVAAAVAATATATAAKEDEKEEKKEEEAADEAPVPWGQILRCTPLRALAYVHFCNNWGFYVLLAWLPSYFTQELEVNLTNASLFTLLPPLANIVVASFVGPLADSAIERGVAVSTVRKSAQAVAFLGPASFMTAACFADNPVATVGLLTVGLSLASFSYAGLYCNHQDMSPRYASILLGMTNTMGAFPGVIGVPLTGYLLEKTDNWEVSMFLPAVFFYITGAAVFAKYGSAEKQSWG